jgi:2-polyprenyl-6-hydroxyphenyl methylase/3-demethylubiquinone-9 3-methyltransferase
MLGPLERPISELYRSIFVDLTAFVNQLKHWTPASKILEVGCGEGAVTERLVETYQEAEITGIDITPKVGRMFQGDDSRVTFKQQTIEDFVAENDSDFDLLILSDVMHHVPTDIHKDLLSDAKKALKPGGWLVLKDWERTKTPIHWLCYFLDRYITGDRVKYKTAAEWRTLIKSVFGKNAIEAEERIGPWSNNIAFLIKV